MQHVRPLFDDGVEDVLVGQVGEQQGDQLLLCLGAPQLVPVTTPETAIR